MKKYTHIIILIVLTLFIAACIGGVYFLYQKVQSALYTKERIALEQEIQEEQIKNLPQLSSLYYKVTESEQFFSLLYSEDQVVEVIKDIERLAREQQVTLTITQKEVPVKKAAAKEKAEEGEEGDAKKKEPEKPKTLVDTLPYEKHIRLELKADGQYLAIRNFLAALETAPYALDVLAINGSLAPKEEGEPVHQSSGSPFLLQGSPIEEGESIVPTSGKVTFIIETALYTQ
jgi:hypothetical protein